MKTNISVMTHSLCHRHATLMCLLASLFSLKACGHSQLGTNNRSSIESLIIQAAVGLDLSSF